MAETITPHSFTEAAAALASAAAASRQVRFVGGGTKLGWGGATSRDALRISTAQLTRTLPHTPEALTATVGAGTPLARAQAQFARSGKMLAIDPQLGLGERPLATLGGALATGDSGPLAHRYGPPQDQLLGVTLALPDGSVRRTGVRDTEDPPGYDLRRLVTGSFGTLGLIVSVDVALQPLPTRTATALAAGDDPSVLRDAVLELAHTGPHVQAFDVAWRGGHGGLMAQIAGDDAEQRASAFAKSLGAAGLRRAEVRTDDTALWARQRAGQRSSERAVLRVSARRSQLDRVLAVADEADAELVGRAALGISYLALEPERIEQVRAGLPPGAGADVLDLPGTPVAVDRWGLVEGAELDLMRSIKRTFDPAAICNAGVFVGGI